MNEWEWVEEDGRRYWSRNKKVEDFVDPKRKKVLEEIMKREKEICELKKAVGEDC